MRNLILGIIAIGLAGCGTSFKTANLASSNASSSEGICTPNTQQSCQTGNGTGNSPIDYGADPTGSADSTAAFTKAIAANQNVSIPCGTYLLTGLVLPNNNFFLSGSGACTTLKWKGGTSEGNFISVIGTGDNIKVSNLTIDGNGANQLVGTGACVAGKNIYHFSIANVTIENCYQTAIYIADASNNQNYQSGLELTGSTIVNWGRSGSGNAIYIGTYIYDLTIGPGNDIAGGPTTTTADAAAIYVASASNYVRILGNNIDANGIQIYVQNTSFADITGNSIHCGNQCGNGLVLDGAVGTTVNSNQFWSIEADSIHLINGALHNAICGNSIQADPRLLCRYGVFLQIRRQIKILTVALSQLMAMPLWEIFLEDCIAFRNSRATVAASAMNGF